MEIDQVSVVAIGPHLGDDDAAGVLVHVGAHPGDGRLGSSELGHEHRGVHRQLVTELSDR